MHPQTSSVQTLTPPTHPSTTHITIDSRTRPGLKHTVTLVNGNVRACTCEAGRNGRVCWHTRYVAKVRASQLAVARELHTRGWNTEQIATIWRDTVELLDGDRAAAADVLIAECGIQRAA